jgi:hypothetical protein
MEIYSFQMNTKLKATYFGCGNKAQQVQCALPRCKKIFLPPTWILLSSLEKIGKNRPYNVEV